MAQRLQFLPRNTPLSGGQALRPWELDRIGGMLGIIKLVQRLEDLCKFRLAKLKRDMPITLQLGEHPIRDWQQQHLFFTGVDFKIEVFKSGEFQVTGEGMPDSTEQDWLSRVGQELTLRPTQEVKQALRSHESQS